MSQLWWDRRGAILLEAAIALPVLIMLFMGMVEFSQAFAVRERTSAVAGNVADLVAQSSALSTSDLNDISQIAQYLYAPYSSKQLGLRITSVIRNTDNTTTAQWSYVSGGMGAYGANQAVAIPSGLIDAQETVIVVDTTYVYQPVVGMFLTSGVTFTSTAYFKPRLVPAIPYNP